MNKKKKIDIIQVIGGGIMGAIAGYTFQWVGILFMVGFVSFMIPILDTRKYEDE